MRSSLSLTALATLGATLALAASAGCNKKSAASNADAASDPIVKVPLAQATAQKTPVLLIVTGSVTPDQTSMVASDTAGRAIAVLVEVGTEVKVGDPLIRLDTSNASLSAAEVNAQLGAARAQAQLADSECKRAQALLDKGAITKSEYDREMTSCTAAQQNVAAISARLRQVGKAVSDGVVRAPFAGTISEKFVNVGEWVAPGMRLVRLIDADPLKIEISVPESAAPYVAVGQKVDLEAVAYPGKTFHATVTRVGTALTVMPRALECEATIEPGTPLKPGMFASVKVTIGEKDMPVVPKTALAHKGSSWRIWAVKKGRLEERVVELGPELPGGSVAIANGVAAGEKVAAQVGEQVSDGVRVE